MFSDVSMATSTLTKGGKASNYSSLLSGNRVNFGGLQSLVVSDIHLPKKAENDGRLPKLLQPQSHPLDEAHFR